MIGNNWIEKYVKAGSNNTDIDDLITLSKDESYRIRMRVAENRSTPPAVLELLSKDKHADVRLAAGTNPATPIDSVYLLALDEDPTVRHGLAEDHNTPIGVLKILAKDDNAYVSHRALKTISRLDANLGSVHGIEAHRLWNWPAHNVQRFA